MIKKLYSLIECFKEMADCKVAGKKAHQAGNEKLQSAGKSFAIKPVMCYHIPDMTIRRRKVLLSLFITGGSRGRKA